MNNHSISQNNSQATEQSPSAQQLWAELRRFKERKGNDDAEADRQFKAWGAQHWATPAEFSEWTKRPVDCEVEPSEDKPELADCDEKTRPRECEPAPESRGNAGAEPAGGAPANVVFLQKRQSKATPQIGKELPETAAAIPQIYQRKSHYWVASSRDPSRLTGPFTNAELPAVLIGDHRIKSPSSDEIASHCKVISEVWASFTATHTRFVPPQGDHDSDRGAIETSTVRWRNVEPIEHPEIGEWLARLGGHDAPYLLAWLAAATELDRPAPLLHITGDPGIGKDLFQACLASVYGCTTAVDASDALEAFNAEMQRCPFIAMNEGPPSALDLTTLRRVITNRERQINQKYELKIPLRGYQRWASFMNNDAGFPFMQKGVITATDIDAIASRITWIKAPGNVDHVPHTSPAAVYLREVKTRSQDELESWHRDGKFAEHVMWLSKYRTGCAAVAPGDRMAAPPHNGDAITRRMALAGHDTQARQIAGFLENPTEGINNVMSGKLRIKSGQCLLHTKWVDERTRESLCLPGEPKRPRFGEHEARARYYVLDQQKLREALPNADWERINQTLTCGKDYVSQ